MKDEATLVIAGEERRLKFNWRTLDIMRDVFGAENLKMEENNTVFELMDYQMKMIFGAVCMDMDVKRQQRIEFDNSFKSEVAMLEQEDLNNIVQAITYAFSGGQKKEQNDKKKAPKRKKASTK